MTKCRLGRKRRGTKRSDRGQLGERVGREREKEPTRLAGHLLRGDASPGSETIMPAMGGRPRGGPGPAEWSGKVGSEERQRHQGRWGQQREGQRHEERETTDRGGNDRDLETEPQRWRQTEKVGAGAGMRGEAKAEGSQGKMEGHRVRQKEEAQGRDTAERRERRQRGRAADRHGHRCQSGTHKSGKDKERSQKMERNWVRGGGQGLPRRGTLEGG